MSEVPQRIGDAERDRAVTELREHHAAGRLTLEEFDQRMQAALAARTARDLTPLFADLPRDPRALLEFLPAAALAPGPDHPERSLVLWSSQDEQEYTRLTKLDRVFGMVHAIGWPVLVLLTLGLGIIRFWWLFLIFGIVIGTLHGKTNERRSVMAKRRKRAGLPPHPDDEGDDTPPPGSHPPTTKRKELE